jgi:hypothetical protein
MCKFNQYDDEEEDETMSKNKNEPVDYGIRLQNLIRVGNHAVHAIRAALDMIGEPANRGVAEIILKSQLDSLRHQLEISSPKIDEVAQEYLHPRGDIYLEFGVHDEDNAYLNYNVPPTSELNEPWCIDLEEVLRNTAAEIVRDINEYEDNDDGDPRAWVKSGEATFFDRDGHEIEGYDLPNLRKVKTIQIMIMRNL